MTRIGLVVPCDLTLDREYWRHVAEDVSIHIARTGFHEGGLTLDFVEAVSNLDEVAHATRSLTKIDPCVIAYACTSGSFIHGLAGERRLRQTMLGAGARQAITTSGALAQALRALHVSRVAIATPYIEEVGSRLVAFLDEGGFEVVRAVNLELEEVTGQIAEKQVRELAEAAIHPLAQALFLGCTGLPTFDLIAPLEERFRIPVLSANQVTMWAALGACAAASVVNNQMLFRSLGSATPGGGTQGRPVP